VAAGVEGASAGLSLGEPCIAAFEEHGPLHGPAIAFNSAEIVHGLWETRHLTSLAGGLAGIVVALVELACTLPVHTLPPEQVLPSLGQPMVDELASLGIPSMALFCGAALDATQKDCEIRITPLFVSEDQAREAAIAMNRPQWLIASWRTDQSGSFQIVDSGLR
jgi:hypothetical protein